MAILRNEVVGSKTGKEENRAFHYPEDWPDLESGITEDKIRVLYCDKYAGSLGFICTTLGGQYCVDWGDGTVTYHDSDSEASHVYVEGAGQPCSAGYTTFVIEIYAVSGGITKFLTSAGTMTSGNSGILAIVIKCETLETLTYAFAFTSTDRTRNVDMMLFKLLNEGNSLKTIDNAFIECTGLQKVSLKGVSGVTNASYCFFRCTNLIEVEIEDMPSLTNIDSIFGYCESLRKMDFRPMSSITSAYYAMAGCSSLEEVNIGKQEYLLNMSEGFRSCISLKEITLDIHSLTNAQGMLGGCSSLEKVTIVDLSSVDFASSMFDGCSSLREIDISNMTSITDAQYMFYGCDVLTKITIGYKAMLNNASSMFGFCLRLKSINTEDLREVVMADYLFENCGIESIDISPMTKIQSANQMFYGSLIRNVVVGDKNEMTYATDMFANCYKLESVSFGSVAPLYCDLRGAFRKCTRLEVIDLSNLVMAASCSNMFDGCESLTTVISGNFGASNTDTVDGTDMFAGCTSLKNISFPNTLFRYFGIHGKGPNMICKPESISIRMAPDYWSSSINISYNDMSDAMINSIFSSLPNDSAGRTIDITGNPGAETCNRALLNANWTIVG